MKYKTTQKDRYGNMRSIEIESDGQLEVPPMASIPQYEARGGEAETHPGEPRGSDTVPAWLTPGEFVVNKEATDIFGPQIKQMNDIGRAIQNGTPPMYARVGDPVSKPIGFGMGSNYQHAMENPTRFFNNFDLSTIVPGSFDRLNKRQELINQYADMYGLDRNYLKAVLFTESSGKADAIGDRGMGKGNESFGLGQISKRAFNDLVKDYGPDSPIPTYKYTWEEVQEDPEANIHSAAWYLKMLRDKYLKNIQNQSNPAGKAYGSLMEGVSPEHYMYQFYNAGPYSKNTSAAMSANKVMAIKSYLDSLPGGSVDSIPSDANVDAGILSKISQLNPVETFMDWWNKNNKQPPVPLMPMVPVPKPTPGISIADHNEQATRNPYIPDPNTDRGTSQNWNKGGAVHLDPGGVVWGLADNEEEEEKQNDLMDFIFPESYIHKQMLPPLDGRPNYDGAISFDASKYDAVTPKDNVTSSNTFASLDDILRERYKDTPFGAIDDHPSEYRRGNKTWTVPKRSNIPVPKDFKGDYGELIPRISFGADAMIPGNMGKGTGSISNKKVSDYQNKIENLIPWEEGYKIPFKGLQPIDPDAYDQDVGDEMSKNLVDEYTDTAMKSTTVPHGKGKFGQPWDVIKDMPKSPPRKVSVIQSDLENNKVRREALVKDLAAKKIIVAGGKKKLLADLKKLEIEKSKLEVELANSKKYTEMLPVWNKLNNLAALKNKRAELQANLDASQTTSEREYWASEIKDIDERISKLDPDIQQKIDNKKEKELKVIKDKADKEKLKDLYKHWNSSKGQKDISELIKNSKTNPNWDKTKNMFNFVFGDLIDRREIARAIAVYLGSRAMGYQHGESIGFVAEQYLERVDKKNAAWDKWMLEHAHKFKKSTVAEYKRTGDPSVLEPIGSAPRMQSTEPKLFFSEQFPNGKYAWEFKETMPDGKDQSYWAYDQFGINKVRNFGKAHTDPRRIKGQPEYKELVAKQQKMILDILKGEEARIDRTKVRMENNVKKWDQITNLNLASTAWDIARWARENDIADMTQLNSGILTAYAMAVEESKKTGVKVGNIIPFLEEALIKPRLISEAAELVSAPVGNNLVTVEDKALVGINEKVKEAAKMRNWTTSQFWEWARDEWTRVDNKFYKENNKTYKEHYQEVAKKKENAGYTPFALFILRIATITGVK